MIQFGLSRKKQMEWQELLEMHWIYLYDGIYNLKILRGRFLCMKIYDWERGKKGATDREREALACFAREKP